MQVVFYLSNDRAYGDQMNEGRTVHLDSRMISLAKQEGVLRPCGCCSPWLNLIACSALGLHPQMCPLCSLLPR